MADFHAVEVDAGIDAVIVQGRACAVDTGGAPHVRAEVHDGVLFLRGGGALPPSSPEGGNAPPAPREARRRVKVFGKNVRTIIAHGNNTIEADDLQLERLTIEAGASSTVDVSGRVDSLRVLARDGASVVARELRADRAVTDIPRAASVSLRVQDLVSGVVAGGGQLDVFGNPARRKVEARDDGLVRYR